MSYLTRIPNYQDQTQVCILPEIAYFFVLWIYSQNRVVAVPSELGWVTWLVFDYYSACQFAWTIFSWQVNLYVIFITFSHENFRSVPWEVNEIYFITLTCFKLENNIIPNLSIEYLGLRDVCLVISSNKTPGPFREQVYLSRD